MSHKMGSKDVDVRIGRMVRWTMLRDIIMALTADEEGGTGICLSGGGVRSASFCSGAASLTAVGDLPANARPQGVPLNYVVTPNGLFHPSCVIAVAEGEKLTASGAV